MEWGKRRRVLCIAVSWRSGLRAFVFVLCRRARVHKACFRKCVPKIHDADLAIGEMSCIDRCIPKYIEAHMLVQEEFKKNMDLTAAAAAAPPQ